MLDVVDLVKKRKGHFEWSEVVSEHNGYKLYIKVFRDALKFDDVPAIDWYRRPISGSDQKFDGVRLPASAYELQQIADLLDCTMLTPKVIDMIWLQAKAKMDAVVSVKGAIVATSNVTDVHTAIEKNLSTKDNGKKLVSCVGKYWCLINGLTNPGLAYGKATCCNYGWFARSASGPGLTPGTQCWQRPGYRHDNQHLDPSQTIRLMHKKGKLVTPEGEEKEVEVLEIAQDPDLCHLVSHEGPLKYLRQAEVPVLESLTPPEPKPEEKPPEPKPKPEDEEPVIEVSEEEDSEDEEGDYKEGPKPEVLPEDVSQMSFVQAIIAYIVALFQKLFQNRKDSI